MSKEIVKRSLVICINQERSLHLIKRGNVLQSSWLEDGKNMKRVPCMRKIKEGDCVEEVGALLG